MPWGGAWGRQQQARRLQAEVQAVLDRVDRRTRDLPKPSVLCVVDRVPGTLRGLYAATQGSYLSRLIEIAGGRPIAPPATFNYGRIGKEAVVTLNPDVVIDMVQGAQGAFAEEPVAIWSELKEIRAVRRGRVPPRPCNVCPSCFPVRGADGRALLQADSSGGLWD